MGGGRLWGGGCTCVLISMMFISMTEKDKGHDITQGEKKKTVEGRNLRKKRKHVEFQQKKWTERGRECVCGAREKKGEEWVSAGLGLLFHDMIGCVRLR